VRHFFLELESGHLPEIGQIVDLDKEESHHLGTVLRGGRQKEVVLTDGRGYRFDALVTSQDRRKASLEILSVQRDDDEFSSPRLVLALAMIKNKRFEWALEKAVEVGVHRIVPLLTEHVVKDLKDTKVKRFQTIMRSAIKQCGRSFLPELDTPRPVGRFLSEMKSGLAVFGAIPEEIGLDHSPVSLMELGAEKPEIIPPEMIAMIGPEGGWSEAEIQQFLEHGLLPITLGPHILRAETAAVACLAGLQNVRQAWLK